MYQVSGRMIGTMAANIYCMHAPSSPWGEYIHHVIPILYIRSRVLSPRGVEKGPGECLSRHIAGGQKQGLALPVEADVQWEGSQPRLQ